MERGTGHRPLGRLLARIDLDEFADRVLDSYWSRQDYAGLREPRRHAHMWVRWNLELVARWVIDGRPPTEADLSVLRTRAQRQAREGVPADLVPGNFRRGARFAWNAALEVADPEERIALLDTADLVFDYVDRVSRIYAEAHAEAERSTPVSLEERLARGLIGRLSADEVPSAEDVELATRLGLKVDGTFRPLVAALPDGSAGPHLHLAAALRRRQILAASEGRWVVALTQGQRADAVSLPDGATIARGDFTDSEQLGRVLDELRLLVDIAGSHGDAGPVVPGRYLPELLLRSGPRVAAQIRHLVYGPLRAHPELAHTLDVLVARNFNRQRAAAELPVHRNTFRDRVRRITELTGIDLESAEGRGLAWLASLCAPDPRVQSRLPLPEPHPR